MLYSTIQIATNANFSLANFSLILADAINSSCRQNVSNKVYYTRRFFFFFSCMQHHMHWYGTVASCSGMHK